MAQHAPVLGNFNAGEMSPQMEGRVDVDKYGVGCHTLQNFVPLIQGPATRRAGTRYVAEVKNSANRTWLRRFEFSQTQAFQIEFGDKYCRFYTNHGIVIVSSATAWSNATAYNIGDLARSGGVTYYCILGHTNQVPPNATYWYAMPAYNGSVTDAIYEIPSPYTGNDLTNSVGAFALNMEQSGDVMYIAGAGIYAPYTLTRYGSTNWQFAVYQPNDGPFLDQNTTSTTIYASGQTGSVTLTASAATFVSSDVGRLVRLDVRSFNIPPWESGIAYALSGQVRYGGRTYKALNAATSGTAPPVHLVGNAYDGKTGVQWQYVDSGYGIARITAFTSSTVVTASVIVDDNSGLAEFPTDVVGAGNATKRWRLGAWSASTEYPRAVAFFSDRLFWAGKIRWWGSVPGLYTSHTLDFNGQVTTDAAISGVLAAQDVNNITWMSAANLLLIGTEGGEFGLGPITTSNPLGPDNVHVVRQSKQRCRPMRPSLVGTSVLYVQRAGRKLLAMDYNFYLDRYDSSNQSRLAYHITQGGLQDMAYQAEPFQVVWSVRSDGVLLGYTFDREDNVTGWHRHPVGGSGVVEAVSVIPAPDGNRDELWLIVKRTINGATKRYVEYMEKQYEPGDAQSSCFYVDCGATYSGTPATVISGLDYLEGQTVAILKDGGVHPTKVVSGGSITLESAGSVVNVGLPYTSTLTTMRIEGGADVGTAQGKTKRVVEATIRLIDTLGGVIGMESGPLDDIRLNDPSVTLDNPAPIFSGDVAQITFPGDWETDGRITVQQSDPCPMTVAGLFPYMKVEEPL